MTFWIAIGIAAWLVLPVLFFTAVYFKPLPPRRSH